MKYTPHQTARETCSNCLEMCVYDTFVCQLCSRACCVSCSTWAVLRLTPNGPLQGVVSCDECVSEASDP